MPFPGVDLGPHPHLEQVLQVLFQLELPRLCVLVHEEADACHRRHQRGTEDGEVGLHLLEELDVHSLSTRGRWSGPLAPEGHFLDPGLCADRQSPDPVPAGPPLWM